MKFLSILLAAAAFTIMTASPTHARRIRGWTYEELMGQADLVVIARPTATKDTAEHIDLPGFTITLEGGKPLGLPVIGVESTFHIATVLKGDKALKELTLHHYREADPERSAVIDGPSFSSFNPSKPQAYLLFLRREADGRYAPWTGQTDPDFISVIELRSVLE